MKTKNNLTNRLLAMILSIVMICGILPVTTFAEQHAVFKSTPSNLTAKVGDPLFASMTLDMSLVQNNGGAAVIELEKKFDTGWSRFLAKSYGEAAGGELNESLGIRKDGEVEQFRWRVNTTDAGWQYSDEFTATWNAPTLTTISSVAITGVTEPTIGGTAQTSGMTVTTPGVEILDAETHWVQEIPGGWLTMSNDGYFYAGETYGIQVQLAPTDTDYYQFADTVTVTLNGHTVGTVKKFGYKDQNRLIIYSFGLLSNAPSIETGGLPDGEVGVAYNEALTASGTAPITWSIESGSLPPGLILGGDAIGGTPTTTGTYTFTVKAENSAGSDTLTLSIVIKDAVTVPSITTTTLPSGTCNAPYSQTLSATGTVPITWSVESGALPDGLSISGDTITGTPTAAGTFNFTLKAANSGGNDTKSLSIKIDPITISSVTITGVHEPVIGETPTYADITTSTPGVTIKTSYGYGYWLYDEDGTWYTMSGLFLAGKTHAIKFTIEPSSTAYVFADDLAVTVNGSSATRLTGSGNNRTVLHSFGQLTSTPAGTAPVITTTSLANATIDQLYDQKLSATGTGMFTWTLESGSLPPGLYLVSGQIGYGKPRAAGSYTFTIKVSNSVGSDTKTFTLIVNPGTISEIEMRDVPIPVAGQTPTMHGMNSQTLGLDWDHDNTYYLVYEDGMWKKTTSAFETGKKYGIQIAFKPETYYSFEDTVTATINGKPVESITKTGTGLANRTVIYNFGVLGAPAGAPVITSASLANGTIGEPYGVALAASGNEPITWTLESGTLPPGLTMSGRTISGGPSAAGTYNFTVKATNSVGSDTKAISITIAPATVSSVKVDVKAPEVGQMPTLHMAVSTSSKGVTIDADNTYYLVYEGGAWQKTTTAYENGKTYGIQVTLKAITDYSFEDTVTATVNGSSATVEKTGPGLADRKVIYSFGVLDSATAPSITTTSLPNGTTGMVYNQSLYATGSGPFVWSIDTGMLPPGLTLSGNTIGGTPNAGGTYNFTVKAANGAGFDTKALSITIKPSSTVILVTGVTLNPTVVTLYSVGETVDLVPTVLPADATNQAITYVSSNPSAATVDPTGKVTAVADGTTTITVTTVDGSFTATSTITVDTTATPPTMTAISSVTITGVTTPVEGQPCSTAGITVTTNPASSADCTAIYWYNETTNTVLADGQAFMAGNSYYIGFSLIPKSGFMFEFAPGGTTYVGTATVNGNPATSAESAGPGLGVRYSTGTVPTITYSFTAGDGNVYTKGSGLTLVFTADGPKDDCTEICVDGLTVDSSHYTLVSGSTIITLKSEFLESLSIGDHTLSVHYGRKAAYANFKVKAAAPGTNPQTPPTSSQTSTNSGWKVPNSAAKSKPTYVNNNGHLALWIFAGIGVVLFARKKEKQF